MIDTHCHLDMIQHEENINDVIMRAQDAGLEALITVGSDLKGCYSAVDISSKYDNLYSAVGIHPHDSKDFSDEIFRQIQVWISMSKNNVDSCTGPAVPKIVALGEIGLDYYYNHSPRETQRTVFVKQLSYAKECGIPVIIHSRDAWQDTAAILAESGVRNGVMHCFSGDRAMAEQALALGFHISIAGPVTFKKALELKKVAEMVPDERLLIETDSPYLAPDPLRGKRNEPAFIVHTARHIAQLRGVSLEDIDRITTLNAKKLFGIGMADEARIAYKIRDSLYLNITNRCTNKCTFCIRYQSDFVKGHNLRLESEPTEKELETAIGDPSKYSEIVFCGYGEPLLRLNTVKAVAVWVKERGGRVRINTNGQGNLIYGRNILSELKGLVDSISVSLDAQDEETYNRICSPSFTNAFMAVIEFIRAAKEIIPDVQATVVEMEGIDIAKCRQITDALDVNLRVRKLDAVG
ncbi:MAG TPA: YchF/TatD family DNA exonuclease [Dissulfurispiraceae bacterium]|nr:YchF/TatD family DNA exonuclease [Dissulfurispiraceae bacterium]